MESEFKKAAKKFEEKLALLFFETAMDPVDTGNDRVLALETSADEKHPIRQIMLDVSDGIANFKISFEGLGELSEENRALQGLLMAAMARAALMHLTAFLGGMAKMKHPDMDLSGGGASIEGLIAPIIDRIRKGGGL